MFKEKKIVVVMPAYNAEKILLQRLQFMIFFQLPEQESENLRK